MVNLALGDCEPNPETVVLRERSADEATAVPWDTGLRDVFERERENPCVRDV